MKLLLDQGVPRSTAILLRATDVDTTHAGEIGLARAEDVVILQRGRDEGRVVVTLDADFHALLALTGAVSPSVIRIRIEGLRGEAMATLLRAVIDRCEDDLEQGAAVTVQENRIRVRRLPLIR